MANTKDYSMREMVLDQCTKRTAFYGKFQTYYAI